MKDLKQDWDDIAYLISEHERQYLPAQAEDFFEKAEFSMTSSIQCVSQAVKDKARVTLENKIKELKDEQKKSDVLQVC